jgi:hypothetical protein
MVGENSKELADLLLKDALKGRVASARLLVTLSERLDEEKKKAREEQDRKRSRHGGLTAADLLGSEDEWESESFEFEEQAIGTKGRRDGETKGLRD